MFARLFIRVGTELNIGVPVMSILHRTYRVTHLRSFYLLSNRHGVREIVAEKVSETTVDFRRENRKYFGDKLHITNIPDASKIICEPSGVFLD